MAIAVASLITSMWMTEHRPTWAFYLLPARMVELLAGAAIAAAGPAFRAVNPGRSGSARMVRTVRDRGGGITYDAARCSPAT